MSIISQSIIEQIYTDVANVTIQCLAKEPCLHPHLFIYKAEQKGHEQIANFFESVPAAVVNAFHANRDAFNAMRHFVLSVLMGEIPALVGDIVVHTAESWMMQIGAGEDDAARRAFVNNPACGTRALLITLYTLDGIYTSVLPIFVKDGQRTAAVHSLDFTSSLEVLR